MVVHFVKTVSGTKKDIVVQSYALYAISATDVNSSTAKTLCGMVYWEAYSRKSLSLVVGSDNLTRRGFAKYCWVSLAHAYRPLPTASEKKAQCTTEPCTHRCSSIRSMPAQQCLLLRQDSALELQMQSRRCQELAYVVRHMRKYPLQQMGMVSMQKNYHRLRRSVWMSKLLTLWNSEDRIRLIC